MNNTLRFTKVIFNNQWNLSEEKIGTNFWNTLYYIMKIMWRDLKRIRSNRFRDMQKGAYSPNFEQADTGGEKTC